MYSLIPEDHWLRASARVKISPHFFFFSSCACTWAQGALSLVQCHGEESGSLLLRPLSVQGEPWCRQYFPPQLQLK